MTTSRDDDDPLKFEDDERLILIGDELVELLQADGIRVTNPETAEKWLYRAGIERPKAVRLGDVRQELFRQARARAEPKPPRGPNKKT